MYYFKMELSLETPIVSIMACYMLIVIVSNRIKQREIISLLVTTNVLIIVFGQLIFAGGVDSDPTNYPKLRIFFILYPYTT